MATRTRIDENAHVNQVGGLAAKNVGLGQPRRPALGDLANRAPKPNVTAADPTKKGVALKTETENLAISGIVGIDLRKVKPRVDSHWPSTKPITRSHSIKTSAISSNVKTEATSATAAGPKLVKTRTATTATLREVKYVSTTKTGAIVAKKEKSKSPDRPVIKRQESNLTRKSLTKIRSASTTTLVTAKTDTNQVIKVNGGNAAIKKKVQTQKTIQSAVAPSTNYYPAHSANMLGQFNDVNIDAGDESNPLLVSEYVNDIYAYLYHLESKYAIRHDHLKGQTDVFPKMRAVLMDWINEVHLQYHFMQETFHMAVSIIDRYLQAVQTTTRSNLQLVGVAALFISSKYEELYPPEVTDFVYITDDTYTKKQVIDMERHILKKLKFELGSPLSIHFLRRFSKAAQSDSQTHIMSKYFIELATLDYNLCEYPASQIAAASLFIALCISAKPNQPKDYVKPWNKTIQFYTSYSLKELMPVIQTLAEDILNAPTAKLNNIYKKYRSSKLQEIAQAAESSTVVLQNIINLAI